MNVIQSISNSSSLSRTNQVLNTSITQFAFDQKFYIKDIPTFFEYYDNVKQDITRLQNNYSHQYLVNQCITKYPDNINIIDQHSYTYVINNLKYNQNTILLNKDYSKWQTFNKLQNWYIGNSIISKTAGYTSGNTGLMVKQKTDDYNYY